MKKGFTLIELLVVISIIGILASLTLTGFSAARKNARDTTRKSDLSQYRTALEGYASNQSGAYPATDGNSKDHTASSIFDTTVADNPIVPEHLPSVINDPNNTTYYYNYDTNATGTQYVLWVNLETGNYWEICSNGKAGLFTSATAPANDTCDI